MHAAPSSALAARGLYCSTTLPCRTLQEEVEQFNIDARAALDAMPGQGGQEALIGEMNFRGGLHGIGHCLIAVLPLFIMCDSLLDLNTVRSDNARGIRLNEISFPN